MKSRLCGLCLCVGVLLAPTVSRAAEPESLRVMSFNLWHGGDGGGQPLEQSIQVIKTARADVVGFQETGGQERDGQRPNNGRTIAEKMNWHYFDQGDGMGVASRFPIVGHTPKKWGVQLQLNAATAAYIFNAHFAHAPYQPYQLLKIPYEDAPFVNTAEHAIAEARSARGAQVAAMLAEIGELGETASVVFVTGDFNEPSALDWTDAVLRAKRCPVVARWPTTAAVLEAGFVDAYREMHADPVKTPGYTWTPTTSEADPKDRHDRIDFVFVRGENVRVNGAETIGEHVDRADVVVTPYPSDHRAVVAEIRLD
jgi:exodeoxyribonuclease-3